jgi:hypothetical protein
MLKSNATHLCAETIREKYTMPIHLIPTRVCMYKGAKLTSGCRVRSPCTFPAPATKAHISGKSVAAVENVEDGLNHIERVVLGSPVIRWDRGGRRHSQEIASGDRDTHSTMLISGADDGCR